MTWGSILSCGAALAALIGAEAPAHANARITGLTDVSFGTINSPTDQSISQSVCVYSAQGFFNPLGYSVRATGSGGGGAFTLSSGATTLPYEVLWADSPNQTGGTSLMAGAQSPGYGNSALFQTCFLQPQGSASLTVTIRAAQIAAAAAGNYSGVLQITIVPD
jgi:hypothetical protein